MQLRRLLAPTAVVAMVLAVPVAASADPPGSTAPQDFPDSANDAVPTVDMLNLHAYRTPTDYRATISYTGLRAQNGNRWAVAFSPSSPESSDTPNGNIVELRRTPGGQEKSLSFRTTNGTAAQPASCTGTRAVPDYAKSKITFIIPNKCWKGDPVAALVRAGARHYAPGTFETTSNPPALSEDDKSDFLDESGTWFYGGEDG